MRRVIWVGKIESQHNLTDLFTKCLPTPTRACLLGGIVANSHDGLCLVDPDDSRLDCAFEWGLVSSYPWRQWDLLPWPLKQVRPRRH